MRIDFDTLIKRLDNADDILILMHQFPDGDTIGCAHALCRMLQSKGRRVKLGCNHEINKKYGYITSICKKEEFEEKYIIAVDVADFKLLGTKYTYLEGKIDLCIDHHATNTDYADETYVDSSAAAACEIVYDIVNTMGEVDVESASALYTGISTDTGCFKFDNTTPKTHIIAARLMEIGATYGEINRIMFDTKKKSRILLEQKALESIIFDSDDKCAMLIITKEMRLSTGADDADLEGITALPRQVEGVLIGITIRERDDGIYKVSVRTHDPIDAAEFCSCFGGGGHKKAAGCEFHTSIDEAKKALLSAAQKTLQKHGVI